MPRQAAIKPVLGRVLGHSADGWNSVEEAEEPERNLFGASASTIDADQPEIQVDAWADNVYGLRFSTS